MVRIGKRAWEVTALAYREECEMLIYGVEWERMIWAACRMVGTLAEFSEVDQASLLF